MAVDLFAISLIGFIIEIFATKLGGQSLMSAPTMVVTLLIVFLSVVRWNLWGLITIPVMVLGNFIGGRLNPIGIMSTAYDWRLFLSSVISFLVMSVNVLFYKKYTTKKCNDSFYKVIGLIILDYVLYHLVLFVVYRLMTSGNPFARGNLEFVFTEKNETEQIYNICLFVENEYVYNLLGLGISIIGILVLRSQGATSNAKEKLIDDKKQVELNIIDQNFRIQEENSCTSDESDNTTDSSKN